MKSGHITRFRERFSPDLRFWSRAFNLIHRAVVRSELELLPASICASSFWESLIGWGVANSLGLFVGSLVFGGLVETFSGCVVVVKEDFGHWREWRRFSWR